MAKFEDELARCFGQLDELRAQYVMRHVVKDDKAGHVRGVEHLLRGVQVWRQAAINVIGVDVPSREEGAALLGAWVKEGDGSYRIGIRTGLNRCWKRFVSCKELCHIVLDKPAYHNLELEAHIAEMTVGPRDQAQSMSVIAEDLAEIAAMEYLFPFELRRAELQAVDAGNFLPIAEKYLVPQLLVEKYLSEQHLARLAPFRQQLKKVA